MAREILSPVQPHESSKNIQDYEIVRLGLNGKLDRIKMIDNATLKEKGEWCIIVLLAEISSFQYFLNYPDCGYSYSPDTVYKIENIFIDIIKYMTSKEVVPTFSDYTECYKNLYNQIINNQMNEFI